MRKLGFLRKQAVPAPDQQLAAEKLELVALYEQLEVLYMQAAAATDKRTK